MNINEAIQKAQQAINGTVDSLDSVSATAHKLGLNAQTINEIFGKYGNTPQGRMVCQMLGTTPEALKADADKIVGGGFSPVAKGNPTAATKFPRLK